MNATTFLTTVDLLAWLETACIVDTAFENATWASPNDVMNTTWDSRAHNSAVNQSNSSLEQCNNGAYLLGDYDLSYDWSIAERPETLLVPILFGLTFVIGIVGNGLVVYVVLCSGSMTTVTNLYLMNLAIADLLFLVFCVPFTGVMYIVPGWPFGEVMCKVVNYLMIGTIASTVMTMMAMSIDRYHAVVHPVTSKEYRTARFTSAILGSIWGINALTLVPVAHISRTVTFWAVGEERSLCLEQFESPRYRKMYTVCIFILYYAIPLFVIGISYYLMAKTLWASVSPKFLKEHPSKALKSRRRVSKMVLMIVAVFAISWLPIHAFHLYTEFGTPIESTSNDVIKIGAHVLSYMNSAMNPVIYGFMSENFRKSFKVACHGLLCRIGCARNRGRKTKSKVFTLEAEETPVTSPRTTRGRLSSKESSLPPTPGSSRLPSVSSPVFTFPSRPLNPGTGRPDQADTYTGPSDGSKHVVLEVRGSSEIIGVIYVPQAGELETVTML